MPQRRVGCGGTVLPILDGHLGSNHPGTKKRVSTVHINLEMTSLITRHVQGIALWIICPLQCPQQVISPRCSNLKKTNVHWACSHKPEEGSLGKPNGRALRRQKSETNSNFAPGPINFQPQKKSSQPTGPPSRSNSPSNLSTLCHPHFHPIVPSTTTNIGTCLVSLQRPILDLIEPMFLAHNRRYFPDNPSTDPALESMAFPIGVPSTYRAWSNH
ncbi:hypothetical protein B0H63DRAFT_136484 [Podospora didyma]|uniref:Uncharacterized protein n=1 Tax=Podospora didyma TaxID=330526 RepID=A0AAE0NRL8_9PEZI|nr:hypothetical protein B0H63DRAFT_136484 [Podospora didyma]